ncbi:MAG: hypothetical protein ACK6C0_14770 [Betaproteobacteria bacterium]|jgi:hypothetical protein
MNDADPANPGPPDRPPGGAERARRIARLEQARRAVAAVGVAPPTTEEIVVEIKAERAAAAERLTVALARLDALDAPEIADDGVAAEVDAARR